MSHTHKKTTKYDQREVVRIFAFVSCAKAARNVCVRVFCAVAYDVICVCIYIVIIKVANCALG